MKTLNRIKNLTIILMVVIIAIPINSCNKDDDNGNAEIEQTGISGEWEFIISPDVTVPDSTVAHGYTGADFEEHAAINDEVFLYEDENGNLKGFAGVFKLQGSLHDKKVLLKVYINPDGNYNPVRPIEDMQLFSTMNLDLDEFGFMSGSGTYEAYPEYPNIVNNTYFIEARMLSPIRKPKTGDTGYKSSMEENGHWYDFICNDIDKLVGWIANDLSDGKVRPMDGCSLYKDGGGYYFLGHEGPGRDYDLFSTTLYYPYEWCGCGTRSYGFDVSIKSEHMSINELVDKVQSTSIKDLAKKLGFDIPDDLFFALEEFHNEFGGFAISMGYSTNTHNLSIYVNHKDGSSHDAKNHPLIQAIKSALAKHVHHVSVYAAHSIHDSWHLIRSWHVSCNTPLVFTYLLGTHNVNYD